MKHKHAELIHAWAHGAKIQYRNIYAKSGEWSDWMEFFNVWQESESVEYRIKPEPKPDVVAYLSKEFHSTLNGFAWHESTYQFHTSLLKITFDGETSKLKSAEVLK